MIEIESVTPEVVYKKRIGDDITVKVTLKNTGRGSGTVYLDVDVRTAIKSLGYCRYPEDIWLRITPENEKITLSPGQTITKFYTFKPIFYYYQPEEYCANYEYLIVSAHISGDCSDYETIRKRFLFYQGPETEWTDGKAEFLIRNNKGALDTSCDIPGNLPWETNKRYIIYVPYWFGNHRKAKVLLSITKLVTGNIYRLYKQKVFDIPSSTPGYVRECYPIYWELELKDLEKGEYRAFATSELKPAQNTTNYGYSLEYVDFKI